MKYIWRVIATFFGLGFFPIAPGTLTSLAVVLIYRFWIHALSWPYLFLVFLALLILGTPAASFYSSELKRTDPGRVVVDEAAGQLLVLALVSPEWTFLIAGFLLFRFFDIVKPYPVHRAERLPAGWGIMADDILAAVMAKAVLHLFIWLK
ncbi:MAG: phosphatidylglycerophosphatase A [Candidatus Aminicenantes bacterium]|nr:phosphatidylglycerophosphatase A [Candidatus Aminicenantes bacterium]